MRDGSGSDHLLGDMNLLMDLSYVFQHREESSRLEVPYAPVTSNALETSDKRRTESCIW